MKNDLVDILEYLIEYSFNSFPNKADVKTFREKRETKISENKRKKIMFAKSFFESTKNSSRYLTIQTTVSNTMKYSQAVESKTFFRK